MNLSNVLYANHQNDIAASAVRPHKYEMDVGAQFDRKTNLVLDQEDSLEDLAGNINFLKDLIECLPLSNCSKPPLKIRDGSHTSRAPEQASQPPILIPIPRSVHGATFCSGVTLVGRERAPTNDCHSNAQNFEYWGHRTCMVSRDG